MILNNLTWHLHHTLPLCPWAQKPHLNSALGLQLLWMWSSVTAVPGFGFCWSGLTSYLGFVLTCRCGPVWRSLDRTLACGLTSRLDLRPASSALTRVMVWTLG